jgi:CheY-like chemotaxis protein
MNVLLVDDDRSTRYLLSRTLSKRFGCAVTEAGDGRQALDALGAMSCQLAILDVQMPVMDGLETLRILRESPEYAALPVVMLTGEQDQTIIREILELGVLEYLSKPLQMARLNDRLRRVLRSILANRDGAPGEPGWLARALSESDAPLLIVDGRTPFRHCFAEIVGTRHRVIQAESGIAAMRDIASSRPAAVFVGTDLGVLSEPLFARRVRSMPALAALPLVAVVDDEEEGDARMVNYDGRLMRTLAADTLLRRFAELVRLGSSTGWGAPEFPPGFRATVLLLCEQILRTALAGDVSVVDLPFVTPTDRLSVTGTAICRAGGTVQMEVMSDLATARRSACNLFGINGRIVTEENGATAIGKVFELLVQRLAGIYPGAGAAVATPPPAKRTSQWVAPPPGDDHVTLCFQNPTKEHEFWLVLSPLRT